uniref:potassium voltage-gated channel subfamily H member 8-like n=1 Tax=Gasterosteus aculeatus aculeatus TaxID=481459 RepID=UPI001A981D03|nr:potassium voltage-gated channel subfamily H member 8-like [Gasterosteus aculeatus aculeatus]
MSSWQKIGVQSKGDLISVRALREVLRLYPEYGGRFSSDIHHNLTYNLREDTGSDGVTKCPWSSRLPQVRASMDPKPPYIVEADEHAQGGEDTRQSHPRRGPLSQGAGGPVNPPCLSTLLGEELHHINALRICRAPVQGGGAGRGPAPQPFTNQSPLHSLTGDPDPNRRPANLLMPSQSCVSPLDLSPRVVDGIEDNGHSFQFNVENSETKANVTDRFHVSANLLLETEEVRQNISKLNKEVSNLNQELSNLTKELHDIMHFLQSHTALLHSPPVSSRSCGIQMAPSPSVTASSKWQPHVPLNIATGLHLHHGAISHPARNVWGCSGMPAQGRSAAFLHSSSPASPCLHLCCSERDAAAAHRFQSQCGPFQTSRTASNPPYVTHSHARAEESLLGLGSAFSSVPVICLAPHVPHSASVPTMSNSHPPCSPVNSGYSHPPLSVQTHSDPTHNQTSSQTPIHSSVTYSGQPQYHTAFSPLVPSAHHTSACIGHNHSQQGSISAPRPNYPVGCSAIHTQDLALSLLGQVTDRDCRASLHRERAESHESEDTGSTTPTVEVQSPRSDVEGTRSP